MKRTRQRLRAALTSQQARTRGRGLLALVASLAVLGAATSWLVAAPPGATAAGPAASTGPSCPASNPPNELTLVGGTPQTAKLDSPFAAPFEVALANSNGCPVTTAVAGTTVTFSAPANGSATASGAFAASGSSSATVGTDANGAAQAAAFTANDIPGSYTVTASSSYGSVTFALTNTAAGVAATIIAQTPQSQAAFTVATYNKPLQALVLDANGNPVEGATVMFTLGSSSSSGGGAGAGATAASASFSGGQSQTSEQTNASGLATSPPFTANSAPGTFTATAATAGVTDPASFRFDNVAGKPPTLTLVGTTHRAAVAGTGYGVPLQVEVLDALGKPVQGASVTFALGSSGSGAAGGSGTAGASFLGGGSQATESTDARGRATSPLFTANSTPGTFTATVSVTGRPNPLLVTLDNLAGKPPVIRPVGAARGSATVNTRYRRPLEVKLVDAHGNPVQGTTVTFSLGAGSAGGAGAAGASGSAGASFLDGASQATETTNAEGIAVSPGFAANGTAGAFAATASVSGVTNPAVFAFHNLAGKPPVIRPVGAARGSATVNMRYRRPLEVKLVDAHGTPVQGATVTFSLGAGSAGAGAAGASGSAGASFLDGASVATETTNADGIAVSPGFSANGTSGAFAATASVSGVTNPAMFALDNRAAKPPAIRSSAAEPRSATVGGRYPNVLRVTVVAADGKPEQGTAVTFTLGTAGAGAGAGAGSTGSAGASFVGGSSQATETTNAAGRAVSPAFTANAVAGTFTATASISATTTVASFPLRNLAGKPTTLTAGAAATEETTILRRFPIRLAVTVRDKDGNPVDGATVAFTAPASGASGHFARRVHDQSRTVQVKTNSDGIAVAPAFIANRTLGGYVVAATVNGAAAAFALVNQPPAP